MLNRLYIVVGVVVILLLAAAFVVPRLYDWSPYRDRMQEIASQALGTPVAINGDLYFTLLPQPQMRMSKVVVGPEDSPIAEIELVAADLALMQFLRDFYEVQKLVLHTPTFHLTVAEDGGFEMPFSLAQNGGRDNVAIQDAQINNGSFLLSDMRSDEHWRVDDIHGNLSVTALRGPFAFNGNGRLDEREFALRVNTSDVNVRGDIRISSFLTPADKSFSLSSEGLLTTAALSPFYDGDLTLRIAPQNLAENEVRGDAILEAKVQLEPERFKLTEYSLLPDENRAGTRLTGAVDLRLGADRQFDAVVSGGVVNLLPDDALNVGEDDPYALVSLITQLPAPPALGNVAGTISVDITELGLRSIALRNVLLDATTDGADWQIENFSAKLPGDSALNLAGKLIDAQGFAAFDGKMSLDTDRLDALARSWRAFGESNPLFGAKASLVGDVDFSSSGATFENLEFNLDGFAVQGRIDWREEEIRRLSVTAQIGAFDQKATEQLLGLLPDPNRANKSLSSFPAGTFEMSANSLGLGGQLAKDVLLETAWTKDGVEVELLRIGNIADIRLDGSGQLQGTVQAPQLVRGKLRADLQPDADVAALWSILPLPKLHSSIENIFSANRPARFDFDLSEPGGDASQKLLLTGGAGDLSMNAEFALSEGLVTAFTSPSEGTLQINAPSTNSLFAQLGIQDAEFDTAAEAELAIEYKGTIFNSVDVSALYSSADSALGYRGSLIVSNLNQLRGQGELQIRLQDPSGFSTFLGLDSFHLPGPQGKAKLKFVGADDVRLTNIQVRAGGEDISGELTLKKLAAQKILTGELNVGRLDVNGLATFLGGPAATISSGVAQWPDGPFNVANGARNSRGRVHIETPLILVNGDALINDVGFDLTWTNTENRIRNLVGGRGQGEISADISICCHSSVVSKQVSGRFGLDGITMEDLFPSAINERISGEISGSGQFSGSGEDFLAVFNSLGGDGSFTVYGLTIKDFDPNIFDKIIAIKDVLALDATALEQRVLQDLAGASFNAPTLEGLFSMAAGKILVSNVSMEEAQTRLFGGISLDLIDFVLQSNWSLTPTQNVGDGSVLNEATGRVDVQIDGTLEAPEYQIDIQQMVDSIQVKAFELELERLEKLRAEQEARALAQAEEQQRRMAEQAAQLAKEEAEKAARAAAERQKRLDEEAAARAASEALNPSNENNSVIELPSLNGDDAPILLLDPDALFRPELLDQAPIDLIEGTN
ncbi:AsmA family protein [Maritalea sp.]|uniref:AsmA family protein n=1 Tax=Maritalea sp. TaxID=2003361 RepID=UPI003EF453F5